MPLLAPVIRVTVMGGPSGCRLISPSFASIDAESDCSRFRSDRFKITDGSGERPGAQRGVVHLLQSGAADAARRLHGDAVRQRGEVAGEHGRIGLRGKVAVVDRLPEPVAEGGVAVVAPVAEQVAGAP